MAMAILITAVLVFAVRGMFLGFTGVIGRATGIICGYWVAYSYRHQLAELITSHVNISLPSMVIEAISGLILFFGAMIVSNLVVTGLVKGIATVIPGFKILVNKESLASKFAGAITNSILAVAIAFLGIWGYGLASGNVDNSDPLQHYANRFGEATFSTVEQYSNFTLPDLDRDSLQLTNILKPSAHSTQPKAPVPLPQQSSNRGTATIRSELNPDKILSINSTTDITGEIGNSNSALALPNTEVAGELLNNPQLRDMAQQQIEANPELLQKILDHPQLKTLLELLRKDQTSPVMEE
ncbi:MAG: CvpA family protein [Oceanicoccus sp.]